MNTAPPTALSPGAVIPVSTLDADASLDHEFYLPHDRIS
jgi:hypothetical protein